MKIHGHSFDPRVVSVANVINVSLVKLIKKENRVQSAAEYGEFMWRERTLTLMTSLENRIKRKIVKVVFVNANKYTAISLSQATGRCAEAFRIDSGQTEFPEFHIYNFFFITTRKMILTVHSTCGRAEQHLRMCKGAVQMSVILVSTFALLPLLFSASFQISYVVREIVLCLNVFSREFIVNTFAIFKNCILNNTVRH